MADVFVEKIPNPLAPKVQKEYFERLQNGEYDLREKLIYHNIRLVLIIAARYSKDLETQKEYIAIGIIGLIKAVDTFDISRGKTFGTYAGKCIENELLMELRKNKKYQKNVSIDSPLSEYENLNIGDTLTDDNDIVEDYERKEEIEEAKEKLERIKEIVVSFDSRLTKILSLRLGLFNTRKYSQEEIADLLNISRSYVSRLELKGLKVIKFTLDNYPKSKKRKGRKVQPIFLLLKDYSEEEIYNAINSLGEEDKIVIRLKYGNDLNNPVTSPLWNKKLNNKFLMVLRTIKQIIEYERERIKILGVAKPNNLTSKEIKSRNDLNKICELLISMNLKEAERAIHKYLEDNDLLRFERFIGNLIILSIREPDLTFTRVIQNLTLLTSNIPFDIESYKNNFYSSLLVDLENAQLYLEIIISLSENTDADVDKEVLQKAYQKALEIKNKNRPHN